jgi:hypothetical protein
MLAAVMQNTPDVTPPSELGLSASAAALAAALRAQLALEKRVAVDGRAAQQILGCSASQLGNKVRSGAVSSFLDGAKRLYPVAVLYEHLISNAIASHPAGAAPLKARHPTGQFRKGYVARKRSPAQLAVLRAGNEARIARARACKRAQQPENETA